MTEATHVGSGKVRELYALDDERLLLVASDRISTFDVVLPTEIPDKGRVLTGLSAFWFARTREIVPNHLLSIDADARSTECRRLEMLPIECVVRGYLSGSGWKDYVATGATSGHVLPEGLQESDRLPSPIFTPATKAHEGHDENIDGARAAELVGEHLFAQVERTALALYAHAADYARERGIIIAETHHGFVCANAGVDASNVPRGFVTILPRDSDASAARIRETLIAAFGCPVGVIVSDTFGRPWREGVVNVARGVAGLRPLLDYRGCSDPFGRRLESTVMAVADELASAAELVMGKVDGVPVALVRGFGQALGEGSASELIRPAANDLFR